MKTLRQKMIYCMILIMAGVVLIIINLLKGGESYTLSGLGSGLLFACALKLIQYYRLSRNTEKAEAYDFARKDERIIYLANKSSSLLCYIILIVEYAAIIIFSFINLPAASEFMCYIAATQIALYCIIYFCLSKKY